MKIFTNEEWDYLCSKINWGYSHLDARAARIMNKPLEYAQDIDFKSEYTDEDLEIDINWLGGLGIDEKEAKSFLNHIIKKSGGKIVQWRNL